MASKKDIAKTLVILALLAGVGYGMYALLMSTSYLKVSGSIFRPSISREISGEGIGGSVGVALAALAVAYIIYAFV